MKTQEIMVSKLQEIKEQMFQAQNSTEANRIVNRLEMLLRNCHFSKDAQKWYKEQFAKFEFDKLSQQETNPIYAVATEMYKMAFEKVKGDAVALIDNIIEEEELCKPK